MTAETLAKALDGRKAGGWVARCPAHDDRTPSLSLADGHDGRLLVKCGQVAPRATYLPRCMLEDISILTAGQLISEELGIKLENVTLQMLGRAKRVHIGTLIEAWASMKSFKARNYRRMIRRVIQRSAQLKRDATPSRLPRREALE